MINFKYAGNLKGSNAILNVKKLKALFHKKHFIKCILKFCEWSVYFIMAITIYGRYVPVVMSSVVATVNWKNKTL